MSTVADKMQADKHPSIDNDLSHKKDENNSAPYFIDNRPETIAQRTLQEIASNSPRVKQLQALQDVINSRSSQPIVNKLSGVSISQQKVDSVLHNNIQNESLIAQQVKLPPVQTADLHPVDVSQLKQQLTRIQNPQSHPIQTSIAANKATVVNNQVLMPHSNLNTLSSSTDILQAAAQLQPKDTRVGISKNGYTVDLKLNPWLRIASGKVTLKSLKDPAGSPGEWTFVNDEQFHSVAIGNAWPSGASDVPMGEMAMDLGSSSTAPAPVLTANTFSQASRPLTAGSLQTPAMSQIPTMSPDQSGKDLMEDLSEAPHHSAAQPSSFSSLLFHTASSSVHIANATIQLPPIQVAAEMAAEVSRQLQLQLAGLNQLNAKEWLMNILQNRLKSTDQLIAEHMGTQTGKELGQKIDNLLLKNNDLARLLMERVIQNMEHLKGIAHKNPQLVSLIEKIELAARTASSMKTDVYQIFRYMNGIDSMELLSRCGLEGGMGRQHGVGDEKDFRARHLQGIGHLKILKPELERNACLHNPDQCAGGPMEILWQLAHHDRMRHAQDWYNNATIAFNKAKWFWESYQHNPPKTAGVVDQNKMEKASNELSQLEDEIEQATANYINVLHEHLGNYDVNSLLGMKWMEKIPTPDVINRVDAILQHVLGLPFDQLVHTSMNVMMNIEAGPQSSAFRAGPAPMFPDVTNRSASAETIPQPVSHRKPLDQRLSEKRQQTGPRQQTFGDMEFRKRQQAQAALGSRFDDMQTYHNVGPDGVLIFSTWNDANNALLRKDQQIRIIHHHPDISDRVFLLLIDYDPFTMGELKTDISIRWVR